MLLIIFTFHLLLIIEKYSTETISQNYEADIVAIFVSESELQLNVQSLQAAVTLAVDDVNKLYPNIKFNLKLKNDSKTCFNNNAGVLAAEEYYLSRVTAFIGPACSRALDPVSRMAAHWNVPIYTAGGIDTLFSAKNIFNTLTRISFSIDQVTKFLLNILKEFQWQHIAIFVDESESSETILRRSFSETVRDSNYQIYPIYKEFLSSSLPNYKRMLRDASKGARVFILFACGETVRSILLAAYELGMQNGEYAFISIELLKSQMLKKQFSWYKPNDRRNKEARKMYESLMIISIRVPVQEKYQIFIKNVKETARNKFSTILESSMINPIVGAFYDCVVLYAYSLNKTLSEGGNPLNGQDVARQIWNSTFRGDNTITITEDIRINENGDREADYTLNDMDPDTGIMMPIATFFGSRQLYDKSENREINWPGNIGPPLDVPHCGFTGNAPECLPTGDTRKIALEAKLADHWWKIEWSDLEFIDESHLGSSASFSRSHNRSTPTTIREITHENLLRYVGLCITDPNYAIITDFATRGTLSDMLANHAINIDWMFKCSIITDITEGMNFLHGSKLEYHGHLKSENCLIDGRFVVKLSNYSLKQLTRQIFLPDFQDDPWSLLWIAPEHLRRKDPHFHASKKGDVYSYAIILQEVVTRSLPFEPKERSGRSVRFLTAEVNNILLSQDIVDRIRMGGTPPYRPEIAQDECPPDMLDLIKKCWEETPDERPSFPEIKHKLKKITKGMSSKNFLDNLLSRMEQYANDLENLVEEKTQSLYDEKKKTDELLYQMIPKFVAEELKKGCHVKPEYYEFVTIFFSDIVGFTSLSAESTPLQVETIGDAYMVASGLPVKNGNDHAREIARLALKLLTDIVDFRIRHKPNKRLKIRIGIHSGSCVAGVVGLKMPRYCLFGDTVNTASRMESTSEGTNKYDVK
ncbi:atrial natriuretic peptide receptor 1 [Caerostris darwini]|uniref:Guanylate cyclase n=1 Tax=Caerostris darwini TaxID=1538125 RepID=A0AAV4RYX8_9ARAC|nr:atrial natriuretic peptide receptor 1 [Caerostris darwini]